MTNNLKAFSQARMAADDAEIERLEAAQKEEVEIQEIENNPPEDPQQANWQKRYSDGRRFLQKKEQEWQKEREQLLAQVEKARSSSPGSVPVTKEELEDYIEKYPKVGALITQIVNDQLQGHLAENKARLDKIDELEAASEQERANKALAKRVPEFFGDANSLLSDGSKAIVDRSEFHEWVQSKETDPEDSWIFDAIYKSLNVGQAAAAINLWKQETGFSVESKTKRTKTKQKSSVDAASSVRTTGGPSISESSKGDYDFTESQIGKMSFSEYEKYEEAIEEARRANRILYDLSAA